MRHLLHLPRRLVQAVAVLALVLVLTFLGLTRTYVGRDVLRGQIEEQFDERFAGRLTIGHLAGSLTRTLVASDVRIYAPDGELVLEVDSLIARPHWRDLLNREISLRRLRLLNPTLVLATDTSGRLGLTSAFRRLVPAATVPWSATALEVRVESGTVITRHEGLLPAAIARGQVADVLNASLQDVQARLALDLALEARQIDVLDLTARVPLLDDAPFTMEGQVLLQPEGLRLNQWTARLPGTQLHVQGELGRAAQGRPTFALAVEAPRVDLDELRPLVPTAPTAGAVALALEMHGDHQGVVLDAFELRRGVSHLGLTGTALIAEDSIAVQAQFLDTYLERTDVEALLPSMDVARWTTLDTLEVGGYVDVSVARPLDTPVRGWLRTDLSVVSDGGEVKGGLRAARTAGRTTYRIDARAEALDLRRWLVPSALPSRLAGRVTAEGSARADSSEHRVALRLGASTLARRRIDSLAADLDVTDGRWSGRLRGRQGGSVVSAVVDATPAAPRPTYSGTLHLSQVDAGPLLLMDSVATALDLRVDVDAVGDSWATLGGTLRMEVDSSRVVLGSAARTVPAQLLTAELTPGTRLLVEGDAGRLDVRGSVRPAPLRRAFMEWRDAFVAARDRLQARSLGALDSLALARLAPPRTEPFELDAVLTVRRPDLLTAFWPPAPTVRAALRAEAQLTSDGEQAHLQLSARADSLRVGDRAAHALDLSLTAAAPTTGPLEHVGRATLELRAGGATGFGPAFAAPTVAADYGDRRLQLTVDTDRREGIGPLHLDATVDLLRDRHRLTISELRARIGDAAWQSQGTPVLDLYADAIDVQAFALESPTARSVQRLRLAGRLSSAPTDTLSLRADDLALDQLSDFGDFKFPFGGLLNGRLNLTRPAQQPQLTGELDVAALSMDDHVLGRLRVESRYEPGSPDIALGVHLRPEADSTALQTLWTAGPAPVFEDNRLDLTGTFRLPRADVATDPGAVDLELQVERASLFFFEYLLKHALGSATGYARGGGSITGGLTDPLFDIDAEVVDGRFTLPAYNLAYSAEGRVRIDEAGFQIDHAHITDPTGGTLDLDGAILFNDYRYFSFDLRGVLDDLQIMDVRHSSELPFYGRLWASGSASLTGPIYNTLLRATDARTSTESELSIPIVESGTSVDAGYIVFADSTGQIPDVQTRRDFILASRPVGERTFVDGMELDLNIEAPPGSTVRLVMDPLVGDAINAVGSGRVQLQRQGDSFLTFGTFTVDRGDYLFTAGEVFTRRFLLEPGGTITWDGNPTDARLDIPATFRTRASRAGLPEGVGGTSQSLIPLIVDLHVDGRVSAPEVSLRLAIDREGRQAIDSYQRLEAALNQPELSTQYATSVLLTNSFLLTTDNASSDALSTSAFNSLSQLVSNQLNRYLSEALPNVDLNFGVQGENTEDLDVTYGVALRLLDQRLIIRGEGVYQGSRASAGTAGATQGEFLVEVRLNEHVSMEVFYRREGDVLTESTALTNTTGAGLSYQTRFSTWRALLDRMFGWIWRASDTDPTPPGDAPAAAGS